MCFFAILCEHPAPSRLYINLHQFFRITSNSYSHFIQNKVPPEAYTFSGSNNVLDSLGYRLNILSEKQTEKYPYHFSVYFAEVFFYLNA